MSFKGKCKILNKIITALLVIVLFGGITSIARSISNASMKISYMQGDKKETWDIGEKSQFDKKWFVGEGDIKLEIDLSEYLSKIKNKDNVRKSYEVPFKIEAYLGDYNEKNKIDKGNIEIKEIVNENSVFEGKYNVVVKMQKTEDTTVKFKLTALKDNDFELSSEIDKTFEIKKDTIAPKVTVKGVVNNEVASKKTVTITVDELNLSTTELCVEKSPLDEETKTLKYVGKNKVQIDFDEDNDYKIVAYAVDKSGNKSEKKEVNFTINKGAPKITINNEAVGERYNTNDLNLEIYDKNRIDFEKSNYSIKKDNKVVFSGKFDEKDKRTGIKNIKFEEDGKYALEINAVDKLKTNAELKTEVYIDTTSPVISISGIEKEWLGKDDKREVAITIEDNDVKDSNNKIEVTKNGKPYREGKWVLDFIGEKGNLTHTFKEDGSYVIKVSSKDRAGNLSKEELNFRVDTVEPEISLYNKDGKVENNAFLNEKSDKNLSLKIKESNLKEKNVKVTKDGKDYKNLNFVDTSYGAIIEHKFNEDGEYVVDISAIDYAGHKVEKKIKFTVDNIKPEIVVSEEFESKLLAIIEGKNYNRDLDFVIETKDVNQGKNTIKVQNRRFNSKDSNINLLKFDEEKVMDGIGVVTLRDKLVDSKFEGFKEGSNGKYTITIESVDKAGNKNEKTINFVIDKIAPVINIEEVSKHIKNEKDISVGVVEENFDNKDYKVNVTYNKVSQGEGKDILGDDISLGDFVATNRNTKVVYSKDKFKENGKYTIHVEAKDAAGNLAEPKTMTFTKDSSNPDIFVKGLEKGTEYDDYHYNHDVTLDIKTVDFNQDVNKVIIKGTYEGKSIFENGELVVTDFVGEENEKTLQYKFSKEANYEVEVISVDKSGNKTTTEKDGKNIRFTIDKKSPEVNIVNYNDINEKYNQNGVPVKVSVLEENYKYNNTEVMYTVETPTRDGYNEAVSNNLEFKSDKKLTEKEFSSDLFEKEAKYTFNIKSRDKAGNPESSKSVTFYTDKSNPEISVFYDDVEKTDEELQKKKVHEYQRKNVKITSYDVNSNINTVEIKRNGKPYRLNVNATNPVKYSTYQDDKEALKYNLNTNGRNGVFEYNFTEEGEYSVVAYSQDLSGRVSERKFSFIIDTTAPVITIENYDTLNNSYNNPGKDVTVKVNEHNFSNNTVKAILTKEVEDGTITKENLNFDSTGEITTHVYSKFKDNGKYVLSISAVDLAGNKAKDVVLTVTTDTIKPYISITGIKDGEYYNETKRVTFLSYDVNQNINEIKVKKDGVEYKRDSLPASARKLTKYMDFAEEGKYEVTLYSKDKAGNEATITKKFVIDKTAPVITPMFKGENRKIKNGEYINKIFTPEFQLDNKEDKIDFVKLNGADVASGRIPMTSTEMEYHYVGQASDKAGNVTPFEIKFTVDVTNPEIKLSGIMDGFFNKDMKPKYAITDKNLDEKNTSATLNGKQFASGTNIDKQDYYNLKLLGVDLANNKLSKNVQFVIDKDKPVIKFTDEISEKYFTEDFIPKFIIEDLTDYTIIAMTLDGEEYKIGDPIKKEGKHVLYIEVKDQAGNVESVSVEFVLDKTPPKFVVKGVENKKTYLEAVSAEITLDNPLDEIKEIKVNGKLAEGNVKEVDGQQVFNLDFNDIDDYKVVLKAVDKAGNETEEVISFKVVEKNLINTILANKVVFYPIVALAIFTVVISCTFIIRNRKHK